MPRRIKQSQLELFVIAYLKRIRSKAVLRRERKYIQKAISMIIAITSDSPCCTDPNGSIDLSTPYDNTLTNTIRVLINGVDRRKWKQSIERVLQLLNDQLNDPCCTTTVTFRFYDENISLSSLNVKFQIFLPDGVTLVYETLALNGTLGRMVQQHTFAPGLYKVCVHLEDAIESKLSDANGLLIDPVNNGDTCLLSTVHLSTIYNLEESST